MHASSKSILNQRRCNPGASFRKKLFGWLVLATILCAGIMLVFLTTGSGRATSVICGVLVGLGWIACVVGSRKLGKLAASRSGKSICHFARSFDLHRFNTLLIRAVYESVREQVGRPLVPLRADDRLIEDLELDDDDHEEIIMESSRLAGRSLEGTGHNPRYGRIYTVRHVVEFLHHQPPNEGS